MEFKFIEGQEPPERVNYQSKWMDIYLKFKDIDAGKWLGVEMPAEKAGSAFSAVGAYLRRLGFSLEMKIDKTTVNDGFATVWIKKLEPRTPEKTSADVSIRGKGMGVVSVTDTRYTKEVKPLRVVRVIERDDR